MRDVAAGSWRVRVPRYGGPRMTRVLVLQGPNLNLLGTREPDIYGRQTLDELHTGISRRALELGLEVVFFQSNHEGALIDRVQEHDFDGAIVNAAGLTHTSVSLRDALLAVDRPFVEVHLSDPSTREPFRSGELPRGRRDRVGRRQGRGGLLGGDGDPGAAPGRRRVSTGVRPRGIRESAELARLRNEIDELDRRIVALINERAELVRAVGHEKLALRRRLSAIASASARCSCASRSPTRARPPRPICSGSTAG